jgi:CRISPR-associated helicase Cas3
MTITIKRHCVPSDKDTGLSPLQTDLLQCPKRVRIADAPTGAGKSFAFQRAMARHDERVLFIVPTRRLAQNLIRSLLEALVEVESWDEKKAAAKVVLWSSDETKRLQKQNITEIGARRVREIYDLDQTRTGGEMIVAVPEIVSNILLRPAIRKGQSDAGIFDFLAQFDHIVFDEFHTITERGFGLAAVLAKLAAEGVGRAKVSFLSATPLEIKPVLQKLEVPETEIVLLREEIGDDGRVIHGDVQLCFEKVDSMVDLFVAHAEDIAAQIAKKRQVVIIYNAKYDLQRHIPQLEVVVQQVGMSPKECLLINALDDSRAEHIGHFAVGRYQQPENFKLLIATASVEIGVTFKADLLLMEPGFEPMNFLQRYGRAARGDYKGKVIVRWDDDLKGRNVWLRKLLKWAEKRAGETVQIQDLTKELSRAVRAEFKNRPDDNPAYFGQLASRAAYTAGLYWKALLVHPSNKGSYREQHLREHLPKPAKAISIWLKQVREMVKDDQFSSAAKNWCDRFEAEVRVLRDIGQQVSVVDDKGERFTESENWLRRNTDILERGYLTVGENGCDEVRIQKNWRNYLLDKRRFVPAQRTVYFPHTVHTALLQDDFELVKNWCRELKDQSGVESLAWELYPESMQAAEKLVRSTGLVVSDDSELDAQNGVL